MNREDMMEKVEALSKKVTERTLELENAHLGRIQINPPFRVSFEVQALLEVMAELQQEVDDLRRAAAKWGIIA